MHSTTKFIVTGLGLLILATVAGCLVSGTFVITEEFNFTARTGFYHYSVDLTTKQAWKDHKDDIDFIDAVGFEFDIESSEASPTTFNAWVAPEGEIYDSIDDITDSTTMVISDLTVNPGTTHITYAQSLAHVTNLEALKALVKTGKFEYYGTSTNPLFQFDVIDGKIIVTFSASGS